jgi:hypothetical protein
MQEQWHRFKLRICGSVVEDATMTREQYDHLCTVIEQHTDYQEDARANDTEEARRHRL